MKRPDDLAYTVTEAAELISMSGATVRRLIREGDLAFVRIGRSVRIRRVELDRFLRDREMAY